MKVITTIILLICTAFAGYSQSVIASVQSGNWNSPGTWNSGTIPGANDHVIISSGHSLNINSPGYCHHLFIDTNASLTIDSGAVLTLNGNWDNSGTFNGSGSTIQFNGGINQTINGTSLTTFENILVINNSSVALNTNSNLRGTLSLQQGTFTTTGHIFTLLSDSNKTANIGSIANGSNFIGPITMQRYIASQVPGWRFLASPVYGATLQDWTDDFMTCGFPGSTNPGFSFCSINMYDETVAGPSDSGYVNPGSVTDSIQVGKGYWCWINNAPLTVDVTGIPARFTQNFSLTLTPSAGKGQDGWNMISNPYPSSIDWDSPMWSKTGINDAIYIWDPITNQYSAYVNGVGVNGGSNIIASSQAFWVEAAQSDAFISCDERVKSNADTRVQRTNNSVSGKSYIKLGINGNNITDEAAICFAANASASYDAGEDALKIPSTNNLAPQIYTENNNTQFAINSLALNYSDTVIPVYIHVGLSGNYTLTHIQLVAIPEGSCIYLEDLLTGSFLDLKTTTAYSFNISDTTKAARFLLHIGSSPVVSQISTRCNYSQDGMAIAQGKGNGPWVYTWKDAIGNTLTVHNRTTADTLRNLAEGDYTLEISGNSGFCTTTENTIHVNRAELLQVSTQINNVNCPHTQTGSIDINQVTGGEAPYTFQWSNGSQNSGIQQLNSGVYILVVTDHKGCTDTSFQVVAQASALHAAFTVDHDSATLIAGAASIDVTDHSTGKTGSWWDFGDGSSLSNTTHTTHAYSMTGTYTITLIAQSGNCSDTARKTIYINTVNGINTPDRNQSINIYNDASTASVAFDLSEPKNAEISLYNVGGQLLYETTTIASKNTERISLPETSGIYLLTVNMNGKITQKKLIK
ncbi:MAG: T9SS type A sorting domain-containing protein [Bacteroidetes bacterium]|nr:T9SS type A sorting domain-containing protein [Bacteroidota bacterium]